MTVLNISALIHSTEYSLVFLYTTHITFLLCLLNFFLSPPPLCTSIDLTTFKLFESYPNLSFPATFPSSALSSVHLKLLKPSLTACPQSYFSLLTFLNNSLLHTTASILLAGSTYPLYKATPSFGAFSCGPWPKVIPPGFVDSLHPWGVKLTCASHGSLPPAVDNFAFNSIASGLGERWVYTQPCVDWVYKRAWKDWGRPIVVQRSPHTCWVKTFRCSSFAGRSIHNSGNPHEFTYVL